MRYLALMAALAVPAFAATITDKQLAKLTAGLDKSESAMVPGDQLLTTLGLPKDKQPYSTKYRARVDHPKGGPRRFFGRSKRGDCLVSVESKDGVRYLRFDSSGKFEGSAACMRGSGDCERLPEKEAAALLETELAFWSAKADAL